MLQVKVGSFTQPTSTNSAFQVTGVGFPGKALILFATNATAIGTAAGVSHYMGMATSPTNRAAVSGTILSPGGSSDRAHTDAKCFMVVDGAAFNAATPNVAADFVGWTADGFTLNFSTVDANARIIGYIVIGGTDLTNAFIKSFIPTGSSNIDQSFTGVGFKPDAMFMMSGSVAQSPPNDNTSACDTMFGFADTDLNQMAFMTNGQGAQDSYQGAKIIAKESSGSFSMAGTLKSYDSDGFTINFTATSSVKYCYALCLKGGKYKVGTFNQATSTGKQQVTGLGFTPSGIVLASINRVSSSSIYTDSARNSIGAFSSQSNKFSIWHGGYTTGTDFDRNTDTGKILNMITEGASPTLNTAADAFSFDGGAFSIDNTTTDATAREIGYMAMGSSSPSFRKNNLRPRPFAPGLAR